MLGSRGLIQCIVFDTFQLLHMRDRFSALLTQRMAMVQSFPYEYAQLTCGTRGFRLADIGKHVIVWIFKMLTRQKVTIWKRVPVFDWPLLTVWTRFSAISPSKTVD